MTGLTSILYICMMASALVFAQSVNPWEVNKGASATNASDHVYGRGRVLREARMRESMEEVAALFIASERRFLFLLA